MSNPIPSWLAAHYAKAKKNGWIELFRDSASKHNHRTEDVMGVASRESNMSNIKGDYHDGIYHGFSLMQLDINSHRAWIESGQWQDVAQAIDKGCAALAEKREQIIKASKMKQATIKFRSGKTVKFTPRPFNDEQLRQMTLAGYNSGLAGYYHFSIGNNIDAGTTGKNYSKDVLSRSDDFKDLMARDHFGKTANDRVIEKPLTLVSAPAPAPAPTPQADGIPDDFGVVKKAVENHGDLVQNDSVKSIAGKAGAKAGGGILTVWGTTGGKVAVILTALVILSVLGYTGYKYRARIVAFVKGVKAWIVS